MACVQLKIPADACVTELSLEREPPLTRACEGQAGVDHRPSVGPFDREYNPPGRLALTDLEIETLDRLHFRNFNDSGAWLSVWVGS